MVERLRGVLMVLLAAVPVTACSGDPAPAAEAPSCDLIQAEPWPEADTLFRTDPKWLGSDGAYSIDLGDGRVLWLFGDTFVSTGFLNRRRMARMVRNSVGVQTGYDPSSASMAFHWGGEGRKPRSFFPEDGETWFRLTRPTPHRFRGWCVAAMCIIRDF